jgi:hypothetical protein
VNSGNPLAPRLAGGLVDREVQFDAESEASRSPSASPTRSRSRPVGASHKRDDEGEDEAPSRGQSWDNVRDGSISRRPAWRRPSPRWVLPFVLGVTLSLGMTLAVRAELYLDLACLVHPPRTPASVYPTSLVADYSALDATPLWPTDDIAHAHGNFSLAQIAADPGFTDAALTPAERWFQWAQRDILSYLEGRENGGDGSDGSIPLPSDPEPGKPRPSPFPEIDPAQCKRDAGVQQASARLTQSTSSRPTYERYLRQSSPSSAACSRPSRPAGGPPTLTAGAAASSSPSPRWASSSTTSASSPLLRTRAWWCRRACGSCSSAPRSTASSAASAPSSPRCTPTSRT